MDRVDKKNTQPVARLSVLSEAAFLIVLVREERIFLLRNDKKGKCDFSFRVPSLFQSQYAGSD